MWSWTFGIAHAAAVQVERMVEQRAVAFRRGLQLLQELREQRDVELIDLGHLGDLLRIVAVMRQRMMRIGNADLRIGAVAGFARQLKRDDARDVALQRQQLQVEHQSGVVGVGRRHADGPIEIGQRIVRRVGLGLLNAPLDFADRVEILADPARSAGPSVFLSRASSSVTESSRLARFFSAARRSAMLPPSPNRLSNTIRG